MNDMTAYKLLSTRFSVLGFLLSKLDKLLFCLFTDMMKCRTVWISVLTVPKTGCSLWLKKQQKKTTHRKYKPTPNNQTHTHLETQIGKLCNEKQENNDI